MAIRYRVVLPFVIGSVSAGLVLWDLYNSHVIESMGMAWDTGAPIWPYQASWLLLASLNTPAILVARLICSVTGPALHTDRLPIVLASIIFWWWLVGVALDRRKILFGGIRHQRLVGSLLALVGCAGLWLAGISATDSISWWSSGAILSKATVIIGITHLAKFTWLAVLSTVCLYGAGQLLRLRRSALPRI